MKAKLFEVRDRATFVPVIAIWLNPESEAERYLLARAGYGVMPERQREYVLMAGIDGSSKITYDIYNWGDNRTRQVAHDFIIKHFDELESGEVIDVEFILGETNEKKVSESVTSNF